MVELIGDDWENGGAEDEIKLSRVKHDVADESSVTVQVLDSPF